MAYLGGGDRAFAPLDFFLPLFSLGKTTIYDQRYHKKSVLKLANSFIIFSEEYAFRKSIFTSQKTGLQDKNLKSPSPRKILDTPLARLTENARELTKENLA